MSNNYELRVLAGLSTDGVVREAKEKVEAKPEINPAIFAKKSKGIVNGLLKCCDLADAIKAVKKQLKMDGVENVEELQKAHDALKAMKLHEDMNVMRKAAGLPLLEKKDEEETDEPADDKEESEDAGEEEEEEDVPSIVKKMAAKLLKSGMPDEDKLADLLLKVYHAGHEDGEKEAASKADAE